MQSVPCNINQEYYWYRCLFYFYRSPHRVVSTQPGHLQNFGNNPNQHSQSFCFSPYTIGYWQNFANDNEYSSKSINFGRNHWNFGYFPTVNHSIFRTAAEGKISPLAPPIVQASINNTEYTLHFTGSTYSTTAGTGFRPYNLVLYSQFSIIASTLA